MNVIDLSVLGMVGGACVTRVRSALLAINGVKDVDVDLHAGRVRLSSDTTVAPSHLIAALAARRYESTVITDYSDPAPKTDHPIRDPSGT